MYRQEDPNQRTFEDFYLPFGGRLRSDNRWVVLAKQIPWDQVEQQYVAVFADRDTGREAKPARLALGALIIKDEHVVGYYNTGDRMKYWGKLGAFWGGLWGLLFGSAFFLIPGIGPIVAGGPIVVWIVGALQGAAVVGGISAVGAALYSIGIPKDSVLKYETSLKANKFLLVAHGTADEVERASSILQDTEAIETTVHTVEEPATTAP